ncbi:hypothetical protein FrEUN1fDRAFT_5639 [Parafrankia sp. EUN1f]|nr:hypothetical protein FrEUN1fDRAFT_5639 [Parafrankia sp. EUN1f]
MANRQVALILGGGIGPEPTDAPGWHGESATEAIGAGADRSPETFAPTRTDPAVGTAAIATAIIAILGS